MKLFCLLFSMVSFSCLTFSQLQLKVQLKNIVNDAVNDFRAFKGGLKTSQEGDSTYFSTVVIEGSKDNEIDVIAERMTQYHAYLADSANKKEAKRLVEKWKDKIQTTVPEFTITTIDYTSGTRKTLGYRFTKPGQTLCTVSIVYSKREIDDYYWVLLAVTKQGKETINAGDRNQE